MLGHYNVPGHRRVWAQSCLGTNVSGQNRVWAKSCLGKIVSGHNRVWAQSYLGTIVSGHNRLWAQSCLAGHSRVGPIMYGHKRSGTIIWMSLWKIYSCIKPIYLITLMIKSRIAYLHILASLIQKRNVV